MSEPKHTPGPMTPPTYQELVEALEQALEQALAAPNDHSSGEEWEILRRAQSAKLVGTYQWVPVSERLPGDYGFYPCACADGRVRHLYFFQQTEIWDRQGADKVTHWAEPLQHPSTLGGEAAGARSASSDSTQTWQ